MNEIHSTQQRTRGYWFIDGIAEVVGGAALAVVGLPLLLASRYGIAWLTTLDLVIMILLFPATARGVRFLKNRITHSRTGYVRYPRPARSPRRRALTLVLLLVVSAGIIGLSLGGATLSGSLRRALLLGVGTGVAAAFLVRAVTLRIPRFGIQAAVCLGASLTVTLLGFGFLGGMGFLWIAAGAASLSTGSIALLRYMRAHPPVQPTGSSS